MGDFHGESEKFSVSMLSEEGHGSERIRCVHGQSYFVPSNNNAKLLLLRQAYAHTRSHLSLVLGRIQSFYLKSDTPVSPAGSLVPSARPCRVP